MTVAEQLAEGRALAALLGAYGHPECHARIAEALRAEMKDEDRLPMLRYDFSEILQEESLPQSLRPRLEKFVAES